MSSPTPPVSPTRTPWERVGVFFLLLVAGLLLYGPRYVKSFRPPDDIFVDFLQEWLSAKNYYTGHAIYEHQVASVNRHIPGANHTEQSLTLHHNAHPPGSVLLALPFAGLNYWDAQFAWNLVGTPLFLTAIALAAWQLCRPFRWWHVVPIAAVVVWAEPVRATLMYGQINFFLVCLLTIGWVLDRRGHQTWAGVFIGIAAGLKLFPAFLFLYLLASGRWKGLLAGVAAALAVNGVAAAVFGGGAFQDYVRDVIPAVRERWEATWPNCSLNGLWIRAVNPPPQQAGPEAFRSPMLAKAGFGVCALLIVGCTAWAGWRARKEGDPDIGWAAAVAALPLVSPMAWQHYYVLHLVPLAILAARLSGWRRYVAWVAAGGICISFHIYALVFVSKVHSSLQTKTAPYYMPLDLPEVLLGTGIITYCGLVLFILAVTIPRRVDHLTPGRPPSAAGRSPASAGTPGPSPQRDP